MTMQAAAAFPRLARFLAESTTLAPDVAEQAADMRAMWKRATDNANASISVAPEQVLAATEKPAHPWGDAVRNANARIGAV